MYNFQQHDDDSPLFWLIKIEIWHFMQFFDVDVCPEIDKQWF